MLRTQWRSLPPTRALPKAKAQPTLATSSKIEQRFDSLSIGFFALRRDLGAFPIRSPLNQRQKSAHVFTTCDEKKQSRI
jgi:hypothetical protein